MLPMEARLKEQNKSAQPQVIAILHEFQESKPVRGFI